MELSILASTCSSNLLALEAFVIVSFPGFPVDDQYSVMHMNLKVITESINVFNDNLLI